jgi:recombination protein RecA
MINKENNNKEDILKKLINNLEKKFGDGTFVEAKNWELNEKENLHSGSLMLNDIIGKKGYPLGKIIEIFGPESAGKTTLALSAVIDAQKKDKYILFLDIERGLNLIYAKNIGINLKKLIVCWPKSAEEAWEICIHFANTNLINLIIVDSVAALIPESEWESNTIEKNIGEQARLISRALRRLLPLLASSKTTLILTNQLRERIGIIYGNPEITPGGKSIKFYSSLRIEIRKSEQIIDKNNNVIGNKVRLKTIKNKFFTPFLTTYSYILFGKGICNLTEIIEQAILKKIINNKGIWYYYNEQKLSQGKQNLKDFLIKNQDLLNEIKAKL